MIIFNQALPRTEKIIENIFVLLVVRGFKAA